MIRYCSIALLVMVILACGSNKTALPYYDQPNFSPLFTADKPQYHKIAPFELLDQNGKKVNLNSLKGKVHVANFFFTACGSICPAIMNNIKIAEKQYSNNPKVIFLSFSVTPWIDNVNKLKIYAKENKLSNPNWHLLTGPKNEIYELARKSYFAEEDLGFTKNNSDFLHTEHVLLIDQNLHIRGVYNGTLPIDMQQLANDVQTLLMPEP